MLFRDRILLPGAAFQQLQKPVEDGTGFSGKVYGAEGERLHPLDGQIAQLGHTGMGVVGDEGKAVAGGHQGEDGLLIVAEEDLAGGPAAHGLGLYGKEVRGADRGAAYGDASGGLELSDGDAVVGGQRVGRGADAADGAVAELHIARLGHGGAPEGEHELDGALFQQVFHGVEGDEPQYGQHLGLGEAQLFQSGEEEAQLGGVPAADDHAPGGVLAGLLHPGHRAPG